MDAAEALFAEKGYNGAGLREITAAAGVRLGLANYHFESKSELYRRVLARRAPEFAGLLIASLETARTGNAGVAGILEAYALPHLQKLAAPEPGWRHYLRLVAQTMLLSHHEDLVFDAAAIYAPVMQRFHAALSAHVPDGAGLQEAFHLFRISILNLTAWNLQTFDREQPMPTRDQLCARLIAVFVAGLEHPPTAPRGA
jgi:AcrR family transcriptional regulator